MAPLRLPLLCGLALLAGGCLGFYLPGVAPHDFAEGEKAELKVNKLSSVRTQLPLDYYSLKFCKPKGGPQQFSENLGEFLRGDRIENSPYEIYMLREENCKVLCEVKLSNKDADDFKRVVEQEYHHNWIVDNLPAASYIDVEQYITMSYVGFPVGFKMNKNYYIYNHAKIVLEYHTVGSNKHRIVGFYIEPFSIRHRFKNGQSWNGKLPPPELETCSSSSSMSSDQIAEHQKITSGKVLFTYDVAWEASDVTWASRWDVYLTMNNAAAKVHWFSLLNSLLIVLFLTGMIAMIMVRVLRRDIARYNRVPTDEERAEEREETGWKLVHADVFRPPFQYPMLFCVFVGTGVQLAIMGLFLVIFAAVGFLSPANRGSILIGLLLIYVMMGSFAGYVSARLYKSFKGKQWQKCTLYTALAFPGVSFGIFFLLDMISWVYGSTGAIPFWSMVGVLALWFGISVPLVFLGAYFGYKKEPIEYPVVTSNIPRPIPNQPWYLNDSVACMVGGILPFGACFVELFFIMSSLWMDQYYYVFGILLLVYLILVVTCAEITIVLCYFQLCAEDYNWWWRSFLASGSTALYVFLYSAFYFSKLEPSLFVTYVLYFGYMSIICLGLFLLTGCIGFLACLWFTRTIYGSIKVD